MYPFWGRDLYLDDHTSNVEVSGNVFIGASHASVFVHSGSRNTITNNVFVDAKDMTLLFKTILKSDPPIMPMYGNRVYRNVFLVRSVAGTIGLPNE